MAKMFPQRPLEGTQSAAELKVFEALRDGLPDDFTVLHSVPVYRRGTRDGRLLDGEIDFLIIARDKGLLITEVKGGGIERVAETAQWFSVSLSGARHEIKDPYVQATTYCYAILDDLENQPETRKYSYPAGHAVWFPDLDLTGENLGISRHLSSMTLDSTDLKTIKTSIQRLFRNAVGINRGEFPGNDGVRALRNYFAPSTRIMPTLSLVIREQDQEILEATRSQYKVISLLQRQKRALISGPAGSGKTFLALEKARRIVEKDSSKRVLLVCFNIRLSRYLSKLTSELPQVDVFYFHQLCQAFCRKADIKLVLADKAKSLEDYYLFDLPEGFMKALDVVAERYDALIVDEGQDFDSTWWIPLQNTLRDPEDDTFYIFYDDNQILYDRERNFPIDGPPFTLVENCRNTRMINKEILKYYKGESEPVAIGPEGAEPMEIDLSPTDNEKTIIEQIVRKMIREEKLSPTDITILTPRSERTSIWKDGESIAGCCLDWSDQLPNEEKSLKCATIYSFKGLESPVVIVTETDKLFKDKREQLMYVAISRAKSHLVMVKNPQT